MAPVQHCGPKGGRACRTKKKKKVIKSKKTIPEDIQDPASDPDSSSDEYNEMHVMRVTICFKNGGHIITGNAMAPEDKTRKRKVISRARSSNESVACIASDPRAATQKCTLVGNRLHPRA